jgi:PilZ domain
LSRIWDAIRRAERQKPRSTARTLMPEEKRDSKSDPKPEPQGDADAKDAVATTPAKDTFDRRREQRREHRVPLLIYGSDFDKEPFHEQADTVDANQDGCGLILETPVARGQRLCLTNPRNQFDQECRVVYVGEPALGKFRVGVAFPVPAPQFWRSA